MRSFMLYMLVIASIINLTLRIPPQEVWVTVLTVALGSMGVMAVGKTISMKRAQPQGSVFTDG